MKNSFVRKMTAILAMPLLVMALAGVPPVANASHVDADPVCASVTLVSGTSTETAGYTEVDPVSAPVSLNPALYSDGSFSPAVATETVIPPWVDPATNVNFTGSGALWVSSDSSWPGGSGNTEGSATSSQWRLFRHTFTLPTGTTSATGTISFAADNAASVYLNGAQIATTGDVYGATTSTAQNFSTVMTVPFTAVAGTNTLAFVVRNFAFNSSPNPTGLLYKATVDHCAPAVHEAEDVKVSIVKYMNGAMATAVTASSTSFAMNASWDADNIGAGSGSFNLSSTGFNSPTPYTAVTADMTSGADYSVSEAMNSTTGPNCDATPYALIGYTTGNTLSEASLATPTSTAPNFTNLTQDKFVIVWNRDCAVPATAKVHILKHLDGAVANATTSNGYMFPMTSTWQAANLNGGAMTSGNYVLGNSHGGAADVYGADTADMDAPAYYTTSEVTGGTSQVLAAGATCEPGKYRLQGYKVSAISFADAATQPMATSAPVFANLWGHRYVIVANESCDDDGGSIGGEVLDAPLRVDSIDVIKSTSTADGTFEGGWKYIFHITAPTSEDDLAMKFSDWTGAGTIPAANNIRISSVHASTSTPVMVTAANTYTIPDLHLITDHDGSMAGRQIDVMVEVRVPVGTPGGSYTTTYGVRTL